MSTEGPDIYMHIICSPHPQTMIRDLLQRGESCPPLDPAVPVPHPAVLPADTNGQIDPTLNPGETGIVSRAVGRGAEEEEEEREEKGLVIF